jgi:hypothetical protein
MPAIVPPDAFDFWLDCRNVDALTAAAMLEPAPEGLLEAYEVSPAVNHAANDGPELIARISAQAAQSPDLDKAVSAPARRAKKKDERQGSLF